MKKSILLIIILCSLLTSIIYAQPEDFDFGDIKMSEIYTETGLI